MAFRGDPANIADLVAYIQEQLRAIQSPVAGGSFIGPKGDPGEAGPPGIDGASGPPGPPDTDAEVLVWAAVAP